MYNILFFYSPSFKDVTTLHVLEEAGQDWHKSTDQAFDF